MSTVYRAPLRIDLAGGTLDIWPLYLQLTDPVTVNVAITRYASVSLLGRTREVTGSSTLVRRLQAALGPARIETRVDCPRGSGLGGSSALAVALIRALHDHKRRRISKDRILSLARDLEAQDIRTPTGDQDYLAALHGGLNVIRFQPGGPRRTQLKAPAAAVMDRIVLFYTGLPHFSGINNWAVFRSVFDGDRAVRSRLQSIARISAELAAALTENALDDAGKLIAREWRYRRGLASGITTARIDEAFGLGKRRGALAGKVCGAGGGGCAFLYTRQGEAPSLARALADDGFQILPARLARRGLHRRRAR